MGVNSLPKTVTRHCHGCDLNPGPSAPESSTLTTRLPKLREKSTACTASSVIRLSVRQRIADALTTASIYYRAGRIARMQRRVDAVYTYTLGQLSLAFPRGRLIEYQLRLG